MRLSLIIFACIEFFFVSGGQVLGTPFPFPETISVNEMRKLKEYSLSNGVDPAILEAIVLTESVGRNGRIYPYVIRVNQPVRIRGLRQIKPNVYDCVNRELCVITAKKLVRAGITNFDAGPFQFNYKYWLKRGWDRKDFFKTVFDFSKSWKKACTLIKGYISTRGYTANAVALYHSADPYKNYQYAKRFYYYYKLVKRKKW
jgi:hypothetical protein